MVHTESRNLDSYLNRVPNNWLEQSGKAFAVAGLVEAGLMGTLRGGVFAGTLSAVATAVDAFITPLFQNVLGRNNLYLHEAVIKGVVSLAITAYAAASLGYVLLAHTLVNTVVFSAVVNAARYFLPEELASCRNLSFANWLVLLPNAARF